MMQEQKNSATLTHTASLQRSEEKVATDNALLERDRAQEKKKLWLSVIKNYPIPLAAILLMLAALALWLFGQVVFADWTLFAVGLLGGIPLLWKTLREIFHRELSVDLIAILAITGSLLLGEYLAGALIVLMLSGGEALEAYALRRARSSLSALAERAPRSAHVWSGDQLVTIPAEEVEVEMRIVVKPGELIPVDGVVISGDSSVSEADLTGEPVPVRKAPGMLVLSGSVNLDRVLEVEANRRSSESKYAQILHLVEVAQTQKAPIHRLADRYSVVFTAIALSLAGLAWILSGDSIYALAVLVVATPCPLILATPIAIMSGIDLAARNSIIVKSGAAIEQFGEVDVAVFDKTGTLTLGRPRVTEIVLAESGGDEQQTKERLLRLAASIEQLSTHVLASSVVEAAQERGLPLGITSDFEEVFGKGVRGRVPLLVTDSPCEGVGPLNEVEVALGNRTFMLHLAIPVPENLLAERKRRTENGQICSFIGVEGRVEGLLVLEDVPRADIVRLATDLHALGLQETILLTGDSETVAQQVGNMARMDRVVARCLPEDKVRIVKQLVDEKHRVLMVGDGINDAPALATATVGVALGTQGLTAAATVADAVLLSSDILRVVRAVFLGQRVMRVARQGIWVGMGLSGIAMLFAAFGFITPAAGALLQEAVDVVVILNALRAGHITFPS